MSHNHASEYGGAIYHEDTPTPFQCSLEWSFHFEKSKLPYCFIQFKSPLVIHGGLKSLTADHNSAGKGGSVIYGGLLDRCRMDGPVSILKPLVHLQREHFDFYNNPVFSITSQPYRLCFCVGSLQYNCSEVKNVYAFKGQKWRVSLIATDQTGAGISTAVKVTATKSSTATFRLNQNPQILLHGCYSLAYSLFSTENHEQLLLYPDGPCHDTGLSTAVINVLFLPCPHPFTLVKSVFVRTDC